MSDAILQTDETFPLLTTCQEGARFRGLWYSVSQIVENPLRYPKRTESILKAEGKREDVTTAYQLYMEHRQNCPICNAVHERMQEQTNEG